LKYQVVRVAPSGRTTLSDLKSKESCVVLAIHFDFVVVIARGLRVESASEGRGRGRSQVMKPQL
jgi:hypothetical protein